MLCPSFFAALVCNAEAEYVKQSIHREITKDSVHQGDLDGAKGLYHVKAVDEVTQRQVVGAIMWEKTPWQVAAIHSVTGLLKTILIAFIIGVWRAERPMTNLRASRQANHARRLAS